MEQRSTTPLVTRTAILGLLAAGGPTHGYELRRQLELNNMHRWAKIQLGSIYALLKQLTKEGLVEAVEQTREGRRPTRTTYRITRRGQEELLALLRESWITRGSAERPIDMALFFNAFLPVTEVEALLDDRLASLQANAQEIDDGQGKVEIAVPGMASAIDDLFEHSRRVVALEIEFTRHVKRRLRRGVYSLTTPARRGTTK